MIGDWGENGVIDALLSPYRPLLAADWLGYRNHCQRLFIFTALQSALDSEAAERVALAAAFHDLGIWTAGTMDYLPPSVALALSYLAEHGRQSWTDEVAAMIDNHHKLTAWPGGGLVEAFRRADAIDVSLGLLRFGLVKADVRAVRQLFPNSGFHIFLGKNLGRRMLTYPLRPFPMTRW